MGIKCISLEIIRLSSAPNLVPHKNHKCLSRGQQSRTHVYYQFRPTPLPRWCWTPYFHANTVTSPLFCPSLSLCVIRKSSKTSCSSIVSFAVDHGDPPSMALSAMYHVREAPPSIQLISKLSCVKKAYAALGLMLAKFAYTIPNSDQDHLS